MQARKPLGPYPGESHPAAPAAAAGSLPDSLSLQNQECPLGVRAEPHAVDADQTLRDGSRGRASCGGDAEALTAGKVAGTPILPPSQDQAAERSRALRARPDPRGWGTTPPPNPGGSGAATSGHTTVSRRASTPPLAPGRPHPSPGSCPTPTSRRSTD